MTLPNAIFSAKMNSIYSLLYYLDINNKRNYFNNNNIVNYT